MTSSRQIEKDKRGTPTQSTPQSKAKAKSSFTDIKFINFNLSDHQKGLYNEWVSTGQDILVLADELLRGGYKLSAGEDEKTGAIMCTLTNKSGEPRFVAHCFTLRGRDYATALARVLYVHYIVCDGLWDAIAAPTDADDAW